MWRVFLCLFLLGCTTGEGYIWYKIGPPTKEVVWVKMGVHEVIEYCTATAWQKPKQAIACTRYTPERCTIYIEYFPAKWIKEHEMKHCDGYEHK